jgi:hypothetical protein
MGKQCKKPVLKEELTSDIECDGVAHSVPLGVVGQAGVDT